MAMTDPIADMLTRIRNAMKAKHQKLVMPASKLKAEVLQILKAEHFIKDFESKKDNKQGILIVKLEYTGDRVGVISNIKRVSKPGCRVYVGKDEIPKVLNGIGVAVLSTSQGVMTGKKAAELGIGGEVLCTIY